MSTNNEPEQDCDFCGDLGAANVTYARHCPVHRHLVEPKGALLTGESERAVVHAADEAVVKSAETGEGLVSLTPDLLAALGKAAAFLHDEFSDIAREVVTPERAAFVRKLRVDHGFSWRALAERCHEEWAGSWEPPSNQIMGIALCERAAPLFGEDAHREPWN